MTSFTLLGIVLGYSDYVDRYEYRIQSKMNKDSCADAILLVKAKDYFASGNIYLSDYDCNTNI